MYDSQLHIQINTGLRKMKIDAGNSDNLFYTRFVANATAIQFLYNQLYQHHPESKIIFKQLIDTMAKAYSQRPASLKLIDEENDELVFFR